MQFKNVEIDKGLNGYVALPESDNGAALVLIQEIFGVNDYIKGLAKAYADMGYSVIVPDLFWRTRPGIALDPIQPGDLEQAMQLNAAYDDALGLEDLQSAIAYFKRTLPQGVRIGAVGYCLGGRLAYKLGAARMVDAAVAYYGVNIQNFLGNAGGTSPMLIHIAAEDQLCPPEAQQAIVAAFADVPQVQVEVHENAGHGFSRPGSMHYSENATVNASNLTADFLEQTLSGK